MPVSAPTHAFEQGDPASTPLFAEQWLEQVQASFAVPQALWPQAGMPALAYPLHTLFQMLGWATGTAWASLTAGAWPWLRLPVSVWAPPGQVPPEVPRESLWKHAAPKVAPWPGPDTSAKVVPLRAKAKPSRKSDDLTRIEGIGPKIAGLLNAAGITRFEDLAGAKLSQLRQVLGAAGPRYALAKPNTWPRQASLLAKGDNAAFEALTSELKGGVRA